MIYLGMELIAHWTVPHAQPIWKKKEENIRGTEIELNGNDLWNLSIVWMLFVPSSKLFRLIPMTHIFRALSPSIKLFSFL